MLLSALEDTAVHRGLTGCAVWGAMGRGQLVTCRGRWVSVFLPLTALSILVLQCATGPHAASPCDTIQILAHELTPAEVEAYCRYAARERQKVEAFWGSTWPQPIRIHVDRAYRISRALVPASLGNRGFMEMPLRHVRARTGALVHEIVHIYAPHDNRFLAEGLAVYLQERLGGNPAFPNVRGEDFQGLARARLAEVPSLALLNAVRTPAPLGQGADTRAAYIVAGSFVGFLIEQYGLPTFRRLYETGHYEEAYGNSLQRLEEEWRAHVQGL
jgi:hypothetical protein